ncbi:hypothetical protein E0H75_41455 [Kribbella capetownensis]|uniref:Uncharacterized protein n=1 Tax=Kribbella capetownensis TaxID=1572659 RepID=A0A4R0IUP7_9ACTN|nr:hypothetical protein [Kribbella capetownensis]TCC35256.1 hypothetical protein E0H75_41455 [Kribbella capetownensis]
MTQARRCGYTRMAAQAISGDQVVVAGLLALLKAVTTAPPATGPQAVLDDDALLDRLAICAAVSARRGGPVLRTRYRRRLTASAARLCFPL